MTASHRKTGSSQLALVGDPKPLALEPKQYTHKEVVEIASRWVRNKAKVVLPEFSTVHSSEIPDVLAFSARDSHMIEVKVSRADFLRDKKKVFRYAEDRGMGNYRYYCCPAKLIGPLEVPDGWGLIYVYPSGHARQMMWGDRKDSNMDAERTILYAYARRAMEKGFHAEILKTMAQDAADREQAMTAPSKVNGSSDEI